MDFASIQRVALAAAQERSLDVVLERIAAGLIAQPAVALARVWLLDPGASELHLAASAGRALDKRARWSRLNGEFSRIPLGARKIGHIGATGESILLPDLRNQPEWIAHPDWVKRERIKSFAGHPLAFRRSVVGVLGLFSRKSISEEEFAWLRLFADQAAVAIANSRAFEEIERLRAELAAENAYLREERAERDGTALIGESAAFTTALQQLDIVAATDVPVLILGESGTGKELFARAVHQRSRRAERPLIKVNCASIPRELFESEFFGHKKGAFTGALTDRTGRFQLADRGTLFLDEVGEIPLELQAKLLRVLQDGELERVGEDETRKVDVRIVAATNRDLRREMEEGRFRRDLYYRLSVFPLLIPPLRERREDIAHLAQHFLGKDLLTPEQLQALQRYDWPGNVRELEHVLERAAILGGGTELRLEPALGSIPATLTTPDAATPARAAKPKKLMTAAELRGLERENLALAVAQCEGRIYGKGGAAELLGMRPTTLASRMKALRIPKRQQG